MSEAESGRRQNRRAEAQVQFNRSCRSYAACSYLNPSHMSADDEILDGENAALIVLLS